MANFFKLRCLSHRIISSILLVSSAVILTACGSGDKTTSSSSSSSSTSSSSSSSSSSSGVAAEFAPPEASLRRLTSSEYQNSIIDILGMQPSISLEELELDDSLGGFYSVGARRLGISSAGVEKLEQASYAIAKKALVDDLGSRANLVGCQPRSATDSCVQGFLRKYGRLFYRRPPSNAEIAGLTGVVQTVTAASDIWTGLSYGLSTMLQSPHFLYRVELGEAQQGSEWLRYTGFERATRLAFLLTGASPDEELLNAAGSGALDTRAGLLAQADRLARSPRFQDTLSAFFFEQLHLSSISSMVKAPSILDPQLPAAMREEVELMVRDWVWTQQRPISELFLSETTFVNRDLAEFYGLPAPQGDRFEPRTRNSDDPRVGLLGTAGLLAVNSGFTETSPTVRGRYIKQQLLCEEIPEPPPGIDVTLQPLAEGVVMTMRERVKRHLTEASCAVCHLAMDPIGLPLEHFDAAGRYRENDHGLEIDASGNLGSIDFDGLRGLSNTLAADPRVDNCMVEQFYSYALGHTLKKTDDGAVHQLRGAYNGDFSGLVRALVQHDAFLFASVPVVTIPSTSATIEAEKFSSQSPASPFVTQQDGNRTIVIWPGEGGENLGASDNAQGQLFYSFVPEAANVTVYVTANFNGAVNDSFHYKVEGIDNAWATQNNVSTSGYQELQMASWSNLTVGKTYVLKIQRREDGARIDSFRMTGGGFTR